MPAPDHLADDAVTLAHAVAELAQRSGVTVAVAESLTSGRIACHLGVAPSSSRWFRGGVVAYGDGVKHNLLGVPPGPVISEASAGSMARGAAKLLDADAAVSVTGVGGPVEQEDQPVGTVWFGLVCGGESRVEHRCFDGEPDDVLQATTVRALELLRDALRAWSS